MFMLTQVLSYPLTGPLRMSMWLLRTIAERADAELYDEGKIRKDLVNLELSLDMGEIAEEDYQKAEDDLMERLRESRRRAEGVSR
jgi:Gas vesicle protein G